MKTYKNLGGDSGIIAYEFGADFIRVKFSDGSLYLYTHTSAGIQNIKTMKQLARNGEGLNAFINTTVKYKYKKKER